MGNDWVSTVGGGENEAVCIFPLLDLVLAKFQRENFVRGKEMSDSLNIIYL